MYTGRSKVIFSLFAVLALVSVTATIATSDDSSAEAVSGTQLSLVATDQTLNVIAGNSSSVTLFVYHTYDDFRVMTVKATTDAEFVKITTNFEPGTLPAKTEPPAAITLTALAEKYAHQASYTITLTFTVQNATTTETGTATLALDVHSNLTSDKYNKFIGFIPNTLDGFLGEIWFTALVSFFCMLAIGYAVMFVAVPVCSRIVMKKDDPERATLKKLLYNLCQVIVWLWVIGQVARIIGLEEGWIDFINRLFYLAYVVVGLIVGWKLYKLIVDTVIRKIIDKADDYSGKDAATDFESFRPLFLYIGEIILAIIGTMLIMSLLGFNLAAVITSAGLVSLGISMGAQDVLKQFFSGLEILATRPFKKGDLVRVGVDTTIYKVRRVNVMNTLLENWDNTDVNIMPNSVITTNKIQNLTRETLVSKVYLTVDVGYGTDVNLARKLVQEAACENPHVIVDGSVTRPYTRLDAFLDSNLNIKLGFYVDNFSSQWAVSGQIRQTIIDKFRANGVNIDYDQIVIHNAVPEVRAEAEKKAAGDSSVSQ